MTESETTADRTWIDIDRAVDPTEFVRYLDVTDSDDFVQAYKRRTHDLLAPLEGARILDAGCGTGDDACTLARLVGRTGHVTGLDNSETMIAEARQRSSPLALPVDFIVGDAHHLELPSNSFDGVRADRTLQHLNDPRRALTELVRVAKPGGRVVVMDPDWETFAIDAADRITTRHIRDAVADGIQNGTMGRQLPGLFRLVGLVEISVIPVTFTTTAYAVVDHMAGIDRALIAAVSRGTLSEQVGKAWMRQLADVDRAGRFFASLTGFVVAGRKP